MKLFGTEKDQKGVRFYLFGLKVYEERKLPHARKTYVLGIRTKKKKYVKKSEITPANLLMQQKIEWRTRLAAAEQKILTLGLYYKDLPKKDRYVLCFDFLSNPRTEAIDAWTFFQYLQEQGIPSKYIVHRDNELFKQLQKTGNLKDIISVNGEMQFLTDFPDIIAQSYLAICSFSFELSRIFKQLPFLKFIFIEHGVTLLKPWGVTSHYLGNHFDGKLVPTTLTEKFYKEIKSDFGSTTLYNCGMPRWDKLTPFIKDKKERKIFIFFTYRDSFGRHHSLRDEYVSRIQSFILKLEQLFEGKKIQVYVSLHHFLFLQDSQFNGNEKFKGVNFIPTTEISRMVQEADLCITDYSSISFDFLYRDVPVIYYCFDTDVNYPHKHDNIEDIAKSIEKWLYNCCRNEKEAINMVKHYVEQDFHLEPPYLKKNNEIFWNRSDNCKQLWQLINES